MFLIKVKYEQSKYEQNDLKAILDIRRLQMIFVKIYNNWENIEQSAD